MGIFSRFSDIVNANLNSMLDRAEDPEKMIRLMIQEMEETLVEVRSSSARVIADKKTLQRRKDWLVKEAEAWEEKAKLAIQKGREDLARGALTEKTQVFEAIELVEQELQSVDEQLTKLNDDITQLQHKLDDAKTRQKAIQVRARTIDSRRDIRRHTHNDALDEAFNKFEHFERRMDNLEAEVESMDLGRTGGTADGRGLAEEIEDLERQEKIDAELARLKARLGQPVQQSAPAPASETTVAQKD